MGRLVHLTEPLAMGKIVELIKTHLKLQHVRVAFAENRKNVETIAICAGSGASVLKGVNADVFFTGEMSHHEVLDAVEHGTNVVLCDHSNTERGFLNKWKDILQAELGEDVHIVSSENDHDPLKIV